MPDAVTHSPCAWEMVPPQVLTEAKVQQVVELMRANLYDAFEPSTATNRIGGIEGTARLIVDLLEGRAS